MNPPTILSIGTAVPENRYSQQEVFDYLQPLFGGSRYARPVFRHSNISFRHMVVDREFYQQPRSTRNRNDAYMLHAIPLGERAVQNCLKEAGLTPQDVDDFFVVSCTGFDIPGLDLHLAGRLGMRPDLQRTCVLGMGCYAAFPGMLRARQAALSRPGRTALVLALELCSLHMQWDSSLENIVVSALFADGAGAVLLRSDEMQESNQTPKPVLLDMSTFCDYQTFDHMAFHIGDTGFQMRLSSYVPNVLAANVSGFVDGLLSRNGLTRDDIRFWGIHPGGSKILDHLQAELGLADSDLACSRAILREYGNMSSATILFVLEALQKQGAPVRGDYGVLMAFGPGLTMESALVRW